MLSKRPQTTRARPKTSFAAPKPEQNDRLPDLIDLLRHAGIEDTTLTDRERAELEKVTARAVRKWRHQQLARRKRKPPPAKPAPMQPERVTYSVTDFCQAFGISRAFFYKLQAAGRGPRTVKVGRRTFITVEAADRWIKAKKTC
jgi:predicted DNA-binding transcriptional regulator AlpA